MIKQLLSFFATTALFILPSIVRAQTYQPSNRNPVADNTLGTQVSASGTNFNITGGLNKGQTLFHSFSDFSVPTGGAANFINSPVTRDIITRVTGTNFSDINGLINSKGANFFLINPNGVTFGTDAQLNVGRAFMASTANGINLVDAGGRAIAFGTNPNGDAPLLTVSPNVLFNVASLTMAGGNAQINNFGILQTTNPGQYIGLIGGNVNFNGGFILAPGGRVDLGGLTSAGTVTVDDRGLVFGGNNLTRSDISMNFGLVDVRADGQLQVVNTFFNNASSPGSSINISGNNVGFDTTVLETGLADNSGIQTATVGDLKIDATGKLNINIAEIGNTIGSGAEGQIGKIEIKADSLEGNYSFIGSGLVAGSKGNAGGIDITTSRDIAIAGSSIDTSTDGIGDAGQIAIKTQGKLLVDETVITSRIAAPGIGNSQGIKIDAGSVSLQNNAIFETSTFGRGNAGNITLTAKDTISLSSNANILSALASGSVGQGGNIEIAAGALSLKDGSKLSTASFPASTTQPAGQGNTGNITVKVAGNVDITGIKNGFASGIDSFVNTGTVGNGGNITIDAGSVSLRDKAELTSSTFGRGNAGDIAITAKGDIAITQAKIASNAYGLGNAGKITLSTPSKLLLDRSNIDNFTFSRLVDRNGDLAAIGYYAFISGAVPNQKFYYTDSETNTFFFGTISPNEISANTSVGNSQPVSINARELEMKNSSIFSGTGSKGDAGDIKIRTTGDIALSDSSIKTNITRFGEGKTGKISIDTQGKVTLKNSSILSQVAGGTGNSQGIDIKARELALAKSRINSQTSGKGNAGDIRIVTAGDLTLLDTSLLYTSNTAPESEDKTNQQPFFSLIPDLTGTNYSAGNIDIFSKGLVVNGSYIVSASDIGQGGNISIALNDKLLIRNNSTIATDGSIFYDGDTASGNRFSINGLTILSFKGSAIRTTERNGNGGNITISSPFIIALPGNNDITANAVRGDGGRINITSQGLFGIQYRPQKTENNDITASSDFGQSGTVNVDTPGADPGKDSTELPNATTDASNQISQVCSSQTRQNKLAVTGRGGLPPNAYDPLTSDVVWQDARAAKSQPAASSATTNPAHLPPPAVGWKFDAMGKVTLIAAGTQQPQTGTSVACPR